MEIARRHPAANTLTKCLGCGTDFFARSDLLKKGGNHGRYCSTGCAGGVRVKKETRVCDLDGCSNPIDLTPSELQRTGRSGHKARHYCSREHQVLGRIRSETRPCGRVGCSKQRRVYPSRARLKQRGWYCSLECRGLASRKPPRSCLFCGAELAYARSRRRRQYCDYACSGKAHQRREPRACAGCAETFIATASDPKRYHSIECYWQAHAPKPIQCRRAGCSNLARVGRRYCTRECSNRAHVRRRPPAAVQVRNSRILELHEQGFKAPTIIAMLASQLAGWSPYLATVAKLTPAGVRQVIARHGHHRGARAHSV